MDTAAGKHPPTPHEHGLWRFLMTVMSEIMKMAMMESMVMIMMTMMMMIEQKYLIRIG